MATFSKQAFSADTDGEGVLIAATASTGTTIHTTASSGITFEEVWLYFTNNHTTGVVVTVEYGQTTSTKTISLEIPSKSGLTLVVPGLILGPSKTITAYAGTANVIVAYGYVNRIST